MIKKKVTVVLMHDDEMGGYSVVIPSIPQLATMGESVQHAFEMAKECLEVSLQEPTDWDYFNLDHAYSEHVVIGTIEVELPDRPESVNPTGDVEGREIPAQIAAED